MILFETTESVIEVLWDVVLAFFIVRLALVYAILTFTTTALVSNVLLPRVQHLAPIVGLAASVLWARYTVAKYEIPRVVGFRLAVGLTAAAFILGMEGVLGIFWKEYWGMCSWKVMGLIAAMPVLVMGTEQRWESEVIMGESGFEEKRIGG